MCRHRTESIKITKRDIEKCQEFAKAQLETSKDHYARRRQTNPDKIIVDIVTGKLGEIAAARLLRSNEFKNKGPDFQIYEGRKKSFDADLSSGKFNFHCKAQNQESASKYGPSWILQWGGKGHGHVDKLFKHRDPTDYLIPMLVHEDHVEIFGIIRVDLMFHRDLIKPPAVKWLEDYKRAIYFEDIKTLSWNERWGILS